MQYCLPILYKSNLCNLRMSIGYQEPLVVTCFDTKNIQRYYVAQVLSIDYPFNFFIISYTTEIHLLVEIMQIATK